MTHRGTWKKAESRVAKLFGSERTPLSGGNSKHTRSDSLHPRLFIEAKFKKRQPIMRLYRETAELAAKEDKIPLLAIFEKSKKGYLIVCHIQHLQKIAAECTVRETFRFVRKRHCSKHE